MTIELLSFLIPPADFAEYIRLTEGMSKQVQRDIFDHWLKSRMEYWS